MLLGTVLPHARAPFAPTVITVVLLLVCATSTDALEKRAARFDDERADSWAQRSVCTVAYYNTCTGWIWCWSGWSPNDRIGVCFDTCIGGGTPTVLEFSFHYVCTGAPSGYQFTGTAEVWEADGAKCPTSQLRSQPLLPESGWNLLYWGALVPPSFVVSLLTGPGTGNPAAFATDHPAAGPTGPQSCGFCYPSSRTTFTFYYGTPATVLCPGSPLDDGVCNAELMWNCGLTGIWDVDETSWGAIKGLYR